MSNVVLAMNISNEEVRANRFDDIMANATPMMTKGKGKTLHAITAIANVPLSLCYVDSRYQCLRSHKKNKTIRRKMGREKAFKYNTCSASRRA